MDDAFVDVAGSAMSRSTDPATHPPEVSDKTNGYVCPFCGLEGESSEHDELMPCVRCGIMDSAATRKSTKQRIGPWHVRQSKNPWAPGMRWDTLMSLVRRGQVTAATIVRGPTTHQLWKRATRVKGLSREFGVCYSCGESIEKDANLCSHCNRLQEPPANPDVLLESRESGSAAAAPVAPARRDSRATNGDAGNGNALAIGGSDSSSSQPSRTAPKTELPAMRSSPAPSMDLLKRATQSADADGLLSAQELATAFKLDFKPKVKKQAGQRLGGKLLAVVVMLLVSVGSLLFVKPEYREQAVRWLQQKSGALRSGIKPTTLPSQNLPVRKQEISKKNVPANGATATKASDKKPPPVLVTGPMPKPAASTEPPKPQPKPMEINLPVNPVVSQVSTPAPAPGAKAAAPIDKTAAPAVAISAPPTVAPTPAPEKVAPAEPVSTVDPVDQARTLWRKAIDAEGNQDFVEAVKCYEKIKKLPADVQPAGLEVRLELAKKQTPK
jgi:hypothetical protein